MQRIALPSGNTVDLRAAADVTERFRRPIKRLQAQLATHVEFFEVLEKAQDKLKAGKKLTAAEQTALADDLGPALDVMDELNDRVVLALTAGWSYDLPIELDSLLDIPGTDLDLLREKVAPLARDLMPDFTPQKDQDSPTGV